MRQVSRDLDLAQKPLGTQCRREFRVEDLDADQTVVLQITGEVDGGQPTTAELSLDGIAVGEGGGEFLCDFRHDLQDDRGRANWRLENGDWKSEN